MEVLRLDEIESRVGLNGQKTAEAVALLRKAVASAAALLAPVYARRVKLKGIESRLVKSWLDHYLREEGRFVPTRMGGRQAAYLIGGEPVRLIAITGKGFKPKMNATVKPCIHIGYAYSLARPNPGLRALWIAKLESVARIKRTNFGRPTWTWVHGLEMPPDEAEAAAM